MTALASRLALHPLEELAGPVVVLGVAAAEAKYGVGQWPSLPAAGMDAYQHRRVVPTFHVPRSSSVAGMTQIGCGMFVRFCSLLGRQLNCDPARSGKKRRHFARKRYLILGQFTAIPSPRAGVSSTCRRGRIGADAAAGAYHPMAWNQEGNSVGRHAISHGPGRSGRSRLGRQFGIADGAAVGDPPALLQHAALEIAGRAKIDGNVGERARGCPRQRPGDAEPVGHRRLCPPAAMPRAGGLRDPTPSWRRRPRRGRT